MDVEFHGANCVTIANKQVRIVIDDNLTDLGAKPVTRDGDICIFTGPHGLSQNQTKIVIDQPGEYEVSGVSVFGLQARAHTDEEGKKNAVIYKIAIGDLRFVVTGHIFPKLSDNDLESIGVVDVLFIPVGGNGYTLDGVGALEIIKEIEPKLVIPTTFADSSLHLPVPLQSLGEALKTISMEPKETTKKLQLKLAELTDSTQLVVLERS